MTAEQAEDFLQGMVAAAREIARRAGTRHTVKINTSSVSLHYYPNSDTWNWFYRGNGVTNKSDVIRRLGSTR